MRFQAVLFDMDGTLLDTERLVIDAGVQALAALDLPTDPGPLLSMIGKAGPEAEAELRDNLGPGIDFRALERQWGIEVEARFAEGIPLKPGADHLLAHLRDRGLPFALATNSRTESAHRSLALAGLAPFFSPQITFGRDRVSNPKPAPDLFLAAAEAVSVAPEHCVVFEDSPTGITGALAANMTVIHVPDMGAPFEVRAHHHAPDLLSGAHWAGLLDLP